MRWAVVTVKVAPNIRRSRRDCSAVGSLRRGSRSHGKAEGHSGLHLSFWFWAGGLTRGEERGICLLGGPAQVVGSGEE